MSTIPVSGHALREKRVAVGRYMGKSPAASEGSDYWLSWTCECGSPIGGTKEGMARAEARELHRVHKALIGEAQEYEAIKGRLSQAGRADMEKMEKVIAAATPEAVEIGMPLVWQHPVPVTAVCLLYTSRCV